ncbi:hypothetical protein AAT17_04070 [Nonlabens sp. MIC269]|uniref:hypothetical protein n=1 Tax=Nonlabens sp. MIC269 TaxID=1476901 RepID=UPI000720DAD2|nr:hypothetical protein [Nonlabens sp. MIC269]ALM20470.1 hypothetical protein AAT17_04070 [Nonlabens sp. MIC269]
MKNLKYSFIAIATLFLIIGCEYEPKIFDGNGDLTLVQFSRSTYNLEIEIDATGELNIPVQSSTLASTDRTFNVSVVNDGTTAITGSYSVPTSVTIPANEYEGILTISGTDVMGVDTNAETLIIQLEEGADFASGGDAIISVYQVCPIPSTYMVGSYEISDLQPVFSGSNFDTADVNITVGSSATQRTFNTTWSGSNISVVLNLVCNELIYASTNDTGFVAGTPQGPIIITTSTSGNTSYDVNDDSLFVVQYDNQAGGFGTFGGSFILVKNP